MSAVRESRWDGLTVSELERRWGRKVVARGRVASTNDEARALAEKGAPAGTVVVCREQSQGRGRNRGVWVSPAGKGVYLSLLFRPTSLPGPSLVPILAGLGVVEALQSGFRGLRPMLKWPNDLFATSRKIGGILAESSWSGGEVSYLVVGVGINVRSMDDEMPASVRARSTSLGALLDRDVALVEVADAILVGLETYLSEPPERLTGPLLERLDRVDWLRDRRARLTGTSEGSSTEGMCTGIAPDGALLFRPDRGALRRVTSGSVEVVE